MPSSNNGGRAFTAVYDGQLLDISSPAEDVEVIIADGPNGTNTLWVNVGAICRLRISKIGKVRLDVQTRLKRKRRQDDDQDQRDELSGDRTRAG